MITRIAAWVLVLAVCYGAYIGIKHWKSPWAVASPINAVLPPAYDGCGPKCL